MGKPLPDRIELGKAGVLTRHDAITMRMRLTTGEIAVAPNIFFRPNLRLLHENHLSITLKRVLFVNHWPFANASEWWGGSALYKTCEELILPDTVNRKVTIGNEEVESGHAAAGILHKDDRIDLSGRQVDADHLELSWNLSKADWTKAESWRWAEEAQHALAILSGQTIRLVRRKTYRSIGTNTVEYTEIRKQNEPELLLDILCPIKKRMPFDKNAFVKMTEFLARNPERGKICRKIFYQIADASRQRTWQGRELLLSTILEAALRTLYGQPFQPGVYSWPVEEYLEKFRQDFLTVKWQDACRRVLEVQKRLRHRNAHPDWLSDEGGSESKAEMEQSVDDMVFLSSFYGYMIMAIAGFKDVEPSFPKPHKEWRPSLTIEQHPQPKATG